MARRWEWLADDNNWRVFRPEDDYLLEEAYSAGKNSFATVDLTFNRGHPYSFDFVGLTQTDSITRVCRKIQRIPAGETKLQQAGRAGPSQVAAGGTKLQYLGGGGPSGGIKPENIRVSRRPAKAKWEWLADDNTWKLFGPDDNHLLDTAYKTGKNLFSTTDLAFNKGHPYSFDFALMTQTDSITRACKIIQRSTVRHWQFAGPPEYKAQWEWLTDSSMWMAFGPIDNRFIENSYGRGKKRVATSELSFNRGHPYSFDFNEMTQTNSLSHACRKIRRIAECITVIKKKADE